jgi:hypothetical protein
MPHFRLALFIALTSTAALAQSPPKTPLPLAPQAERAQQADCAHANAQATVGQGGDVKVPTPENKSLSQKLAQSNGVICPPDRVDPAIKVPTPQHGAMPVIPPPGTPASPDQSVKPK